jgi:mRNA-degrading endonuclease RelE of RelBE toxin-antitoxin system
MRYSTGRTYSIALHKDAQADLNRIDEEDEDAAADIEIFLEEAKNNQETLDNLTRNGYVQYGESPIDVKEWGEAKRSKYNLWRLKLLWLRGPAAKYRIIYAFHPVEYRYYVLGIVERNFGYDLRHERSKQILAAYDSLDIPRY